MNSKLYGLAELRSLENEDKEMVVEGYAIKFDQPTQPMFKELYGYTEKVSRNALNECDLSDVPFKYNHNDSKMILARTRNHSLNLSIDDIGLKIRATLNPNIPDHVAIYEGIKSGLLDKMSFAFYVDDELNDYDGESRTVTINKITRLLDVSVVDEPAYDSTEIYARNLEKLDKQVKDNLELRKRKLEILLSL